LIKEEQMSHYLHHTDPDSTHAVADSADQASQAPTPATIARANMSQPTTGRVRERTIASWPLVLLAAPAAVAVWSGWVGIGQMTGFGQVHPLPGIWDSLHIDSAITLPIGVEAYAAYALRAWLSTSAAISTAARRFARWSAIVSLLLGMAGQVAYHLLNQASVVHAPWAITTAVACLPVLVLGMGAALAHLLRSSIDDNPVPSRSAVEVPGQTATTGTAGGNSAISGRTRTGRVHPISHDGDAESAHYQSDHPSNIHRLLAEARIISEHLLDSGRRVSRRTLRDTGLRGSNADLGAVARILRFELATAHGHDEL
jgi:hypothetical protein